MFSPTRVVCSAGAGTLRTPSIKFLGRRIFPELVDHAPAPHPASPTGNLPHYATPPSSSSSAPASVSTTSSHSSFSTYRDHAQQHGPLQKTIRPGGAIGSVPGSRLGPVEPPPGHFFDRSELGVRFARRPLLAAEIEAVESGGAALFG